MPVYLPSSGKLLTHSFDSKELGIRPEELDEWIAAHGRQAGTKLYGNDAVIVKPFDTDNATVLYCPECP
jgi:hypothetical protein